LNAKICAQNNEYKDLISGNVLQLPHIVELKNGCFKVFKGNDKNKIQKVSNARTIVEKVLKINSSL